MAAQPPLPGPAGLGTLCSLCSLATLVRPPPSQIDPFRDKVVALISGNALRHSRKAHNEPRSLEGFQLTNGNDSL